MCEKLLNTIVEKYKSGYYHNTTIYKYRPEVRKDFYIFNCDHIEIIYDLMACDIKEEDIDFVYDNNFDSGDNKIKLMEYIVDLENKNNIKKTLLHLAWYFIVEEKRIIRIFKDKPEILFLDIKGKTLVEYNIRDYIATLEFKRNSNMIFGLLGAINKRYNIEKEKKEKNKKLEEEI